MALRVGQFSGFLHSQTQKPYHPEGGWIHIYSHSWLLAYCCHAHGTRFGPRSGAGPTDRQPCASWEGLARAAYALWESLMTVSEYLKYDHAQG
ncbi:hypothetical protein ACOIDN_31425, partial [Klebsiella pneumoniae]|uniref:hypothetical protein n=1 Tax=Klebsiella pneumoniae TaxID=573 RepID=UPI003B5C2AEB